MGERGKSVFEDNIDDILSNKIIDHTKMSDNIYVKNGTNSPEKQVEKKRSGDFFKTTLSIVPIFFIILFVIKLLTHNRNKKI